MSIFAFFQYLGDLHQLKKPVPSGGAMRSQYALYHVIKQQNILYYARMALCRPGAFLSCGAGTSGQHKLNFIPGAEPHHHSDFKKKSE